MRKPSLPSVKNCSNILERNGLISPEESRAHTPCKRFEMERCNDLWQTDFKENILLAEESRCFPLDILDDRFRFCIKIDSKSSTLAVKDSFTAAFQEFGLPNAIFSDNGRQFSGFHGGYTQFERFLMELDILPIHGRIMHPPNPGKD